VLHTIILKRIEICYVTISSKLIGIMLWGKIVHIGQIPSLICEATSSHRKVFQQEEFLASVVYSTKV